MKLFLLALTTYAMGSSIVTLKTRENVITILSTGNGPLYTIKDLAGNELASQLTLKQLEAHDSNLYEMVRDAVAKKPELHAGK